MHLDGTEQTQINTQDLTCPICMCIADDPKITSCCHRVFCTKDANPNRYDNGCPLCREKDFSFHSSPKHKEMLDQLTIKCICSQRIAPDEYESHLNRCPNVTFTCPHNICREKNDSVTYNSQQLVNHLARYHCDEVPLLGSTYINKNSVESYKKASIKYDDLVSTLYSIVYPKMIDIQLKNGSFIQRNFSIFKCPHGHKLIDADHTKRKRKNGSVYSSTGYNCDICHHSISDGQSWHCSCTNSGYDKCSACFVFQLYNIDNQVLKLASKDKEKQQARTRQETVRDIVRVPRGLFTLLTRDMDEEDDDDDDEEDEIDHELLALRNRSPFLHRQNTTERRNNEEIESNLQEDQNSIL